MRDESRAREFPAEGEKSRKADCAKNAKIGAGNGKIQAFRAEIPENSAEKKKNQPIRAKNTEFGAGRWKNLPIRASGEAAVKKCKTWEENGKLFLTLWHLRIRTIL